MSVFDGPLKVYATESTLQNYSSTFHISPFLLSIVSEEGREDFRELEPPFFKTLKFVSTRASTIC